MIDQDTVACVLGHISAKHQRRPGHGGVSHADLIARTGLQPWEVVMACSELMARRVITGRRVDGRDVTLFYPRPAHWRD